MLQLAEEQQMNCPGMELNLPGELEKANSVHIRAVSVYQVPMI